MTLGEDISLNHSARYVFDNYSLTCRHRFTWNSPWNIPNCSSRSERSSMSEPIMTVIVLQKTFELEERKPIDAGAQYVLLLLNIIRGCLY